MERMFPVELFEPRKIWVTSSNTVNQNPSIWGQGNKAIAYFDHPSEACFQFCKELGEGERKYENNWLYARLTDPLLKGPPGIEFLLNVSPSFQDNPAILCSTYKQVQRSVRGRLEVKRGNLQRESILWPKGEVLNCTWENAEDLGTSCLLPVLSLNSSPTFFLPCDLAKLPWRFYASILQAIKWANCGVDLMGLFWVLNKLFYRVKHLVNVG